MIQLAHVRGVGEISGACSLALARVQFSIEWQKKMYFFALSMQVWNTSSNECSSEKPGLPYSTELHSR